MCVCTKVERAVVASFQRCFETLSKKFFDVDSYKLRVRIKASPLS